MGPLGAKWQWDLNQNRNIYLEKIHLKNAEFHLPSPSHSKKDDKKFNHILDFLNEILQQKPLSHCSLIKLTPHQNTDNQYQGLINFRDHFQTTCRLELILSLDLSITNNLLNSSLKESTPSLVKASHLIWKSAVCLTFMEPNSFKET